MQCGDRVTLSLGCSIELAKYKNLKPLATLSREFCGGDEELFLSGMETELRRLVCRQILCQLDVENDLYEALAGDDVDSLVAFCKKEMNHVPQRPHLEITPAATGDRNAGSGASSGSGGCPSPKAPAKKGPAKKGQG